MSDRAFVVTVSDRVFARTMLDRSGPAVMELLDHSGFEVAGFDVVPDSRERIIDLLMETAGEYDLVVTTGGTGLGPRDLTPQATLAVLDYEVPGLAEEMRRSGRASTPMAALSRAVAGVRGRTLILNLPGSERGAVESLGAVLDVLPHALSLLRGHTAHRESKR